MKIEQLHLENFGKFRDHSLILEPGLQVIHGDNEDGKSTVMAFAQMMFYGHGGKSKDVAVNPRRRYRPWRGGPMKGMIRFSARGHRYRLERSFGQSNSTDQVTLWDETLGERVRLTSGNDPGKEFFGMGETAFARSVFIRQGGSLMAGSGPDELTQQLANLVSTGTEETSYQAVLSRLNDVTEALVSKNEKKGRLVEARSALEELIRARSMAEADEKRKAVDQAALAELDRQRQSLTEEITRLEAAIRRQELHAELESLQLRLSHAADRAALQADLTQRESALTRSGGSIDETWISQVQLAWDDWAQLTAAEERAADVKADLLRQLARLKVDQPPLISPERLTELREQETRLKEQTTLAQATSASVQALERCLELEDELTRLDGEIRQVRQTLSEAEADRELNQSLVGELDRERIIGQKQLDEAEAELYRLQAQVTMKGERLAQLTERLESDQGEFLARQELARQRLEAERVQLADSAQKQKLQRRLGLLLALGSLIPALYLGLTVDPLYYAIALLSLGLAALALGDRRRVRRDDLVRQMGQLTVKTEVQATRFAELAAERSQLEQELALIRGRTADAGVRVEGLTRAQQELDLAWRDAREGLLADEHSCQAGQAQLQSLEQKKTELAQAREASGIRGTRFELMELKAALDQQSAQARDAAAGIREILRMNQCADPAEFTDQYYAGTAWQQELTRIQSALASQEADCLARREQLTLARTRLLDQISRYKPVTDPEAVPDLLAMVRREVAEVQTLALRLVTLRSRDGEEPLTAEELRRQLDSIRDQLTAPDLSAPEQPMTGAELADSLRRKQAERSALDQQLASGHARILEQYRGKPNVSQIEDQLHSQRQIVSQREDAWQSLQIARRVMGEAWSELQETFGPKLNDATARILGELTRGRYRQVRINRNLEVTVEDPQSQSLYEWGFLSGGTIDQTYLALRLAITGLLTEEGEPLPLFLDDVLTQYDDDRARVALEFLKKESDAPRQILLFTCHRRISDWARGSGVPVLTLEEPAAGSADPQHLIME